MRKSFKLMLISILAVLLSNYAYGNKGQEIFQKCIECHGDNGLGNKEKNAPKIAGQHEWYILSSLQDFLSGTRKNPEMMPIIEGLSQQDLVDISKYVSQME